MHLSSPQLPFFLKVLPASQTMHCCCFCRAGWLVLIGGLLNLSMLSCPSFLGIVETPHRRAKTWLPEGLDDANWKCELPKGWNLTFEKWEMGRNQVNTFRLPSPFLCFARKEHGLYLHPFWRSPFCRGRKSAKWPTVSHTVVPVQSGITLQRFHLSSPHFLVYLPLITWKIRILGHNWCKILKSVVVNMHNSVPLSRKYLLPRCKEWA